MNRPEPLTPLDCDLRRLPNMPLDVQRLLDSDLADTASGDEFRAAVLLWCRAWKEVPAASVPNNDRRLAIWTGLPLDEWERVKDRALDGFMECSDGRLYHPVVAEMANAAWEKCERQREKARSRWSKNKPAAKRSVRTATVQKGKADRAERMRAARSLGTHTATEWGLMLAAFNGRCLKCGSADMIVKDHITPVYLGGSDSIENLQPLCHPCNSAKSGECIDHRDEANPHWRDTVTPAAASDRQASHAKFSHAQRLQEEEEGEVEEERLLSEPSVADLDDEEIPFARKSAEPPKPPRRRKAPPSSPGPFDELWSLWPKQGRGRTTKAKAHTALAARKEPPAAILDAARAYLRSKDATKDGGDFVPGLHVWITGKLDAWLELSSEPAPTAAQASAPAASLPIAGPKWWRDAAEMLARKEPALWRSYLSQCEPAEKRGLVYTQSALTRDKLNAQFRGDISRALGFEIDALDPPEKALSR